MSRKECGTEAREIVEECWRYQHRATTALDFVCSTCVAAALQARDEEIARLREGVANPSPCATAYSGDGWRCDTHNAPMIPTPTCHIGVRHVREGLEAERDRLADRVRAVEEIIVQALDVTCDSRLSPAEALVHMRAVLRAALNNS